VKEDTSDISDVIFITYNSAPSSFGSLLCLT